MEFSFRLFVLIIEGAITVQCFVIGLIFLVSRENVGNRYLGAYLLLRSFNFLNIILSEFGSEYSTDIFYITTGFYAPLLLFYLFDQLGIKKSIFDKFLILLLPFAVSSYWFLHKTDFTIITDTFQGMRDLPVDLVYALIMGYALYLIYQSEKRILDHRKSKIKYLWLKALFIMPLGHVILYYSVLVLFDLGSLTLIIYLIFVIVFINGFIIVGFKYPDLITGPANLKTRLQENPENKYAYSDLTDEEAYQIVEKLHNIIVREELYKDTDIKLEDVAYKIAKIPKDVSQTVNQYLNKNFKEYINDIRIESAAKILSDSSKEDWRILDVMYEVGFNSKSSFNTYFKDKYGMTPRQYRKKHIGK